MGIYLDGMFYGCSGAGRVYESLLEAFATRPDFGDIHTLVPRARKEQFLEQFGGLPVKPSFVRYGPMSVGDLLWKSRALSSLKKSARLFFFPGHNVPIYMPGKYVMMVHDLTVFSERFALSRHKKEGFRRLLARAVQGTEDVVTISAATRRDIIREFNVPAENIRVIYPWVRKEFSLPAEGDPCVAGEYILYLGLRIAHKNVEGVLQAFALLLEWFPELKLVIAGPRYSTPDMVDKWMNDPRVKGRIVEMPEVTDDEIRNLFAGARAMVFPSFAEGFGLPPLEAMAAGVPVVCSDIAVFREVYGGAVRYVDPESHVSIARGVRDVLSDPVLNTTLREKGIERAALYRWERSAPKFIDLVEAYL
ncbi:MAG: glycosyltransferase family 4 protein [Syntrophorhabdaceae bacterium]|nr:glycosyltransferase family 4 protein [Syntrophorhabdaceae bacterium]